MNSNIFVYVASLQLTSIGQDLTDKLGIATTTQSANDGTVTIIVDKSPDPPGYRLDLRTATASGSTHFQLDYQQGKLAKRVFSKDTYRLALVRALGLRKGKSLNILDATGGFGRDGFTLAALGAQVTMLEANPLIAAITSNALQRASSDELTRDPISRITFMQQDSIEFLSDTNRMRAFDCIYLDPMFPPMSKNAEVKKEAQFLRLLSHGSSGLIPPDNTSDLLRLACLSGVKKVVLKRHKALPVTQSPAPVGVIQGKTIRFEIFQN